MDSRRPAEDGSSPEAAEFVRYCYRRRRVGWPELYDEMCLVANRGLYRGWGYSELGERGIGFSLFDMSRLAALVGRIAREEADRRSGVVTGVAAGSPVPEGPHAVEPVEAPMASGEPMARLVVAALGAR